MTATEPDARSERFVKRSFSSAPPPSEYGDLDELDADDEANKPPLSMKVLVAGMSLFVGSLMCFVAAGSLAPGAPVVDETAQSRILELQSQIKTAEVNTESLPNVEQVNRSLVTAQRAAGEVAALQNGYRVLAPKVALASEAEDGELDPQWIEDASRHLTSYFALDIDKSLLAPWYLLGTDAQEVDHTGVPELFNSGFQWEAQVPVEINTDGTVSVFWVATSEGKVLAWAEGTYDTTRQVFTAVQVGTTSAGAAKQLPGWQGVDDE